jgi:hypothetical protein
MSDKFGSKSVDDSGWGGCFESCAGGKWRYVWDGY